MKQFGLLALLCSSVLAPISALEPCDLSIVEIFNGTTMNACTADTDFSGGSPAELMRLCTSPACLKFRAAMNVNIVKDCVIGDMNVKAFADTFRSVCRVLDTSDTSDTTTTTTTTTRPTPTTARTPTVSPVVSEETTTRPTSTTVEPLTDDPATTEPPTTSMDQDTSANETVSPPAPFASPTPTAVIKTTRDTGSELSEIMIGLTIVGSVLIVALAGVCIVFLCRKQHDKHDRPGADHAAYVDMSGAGTAELTVTRSNEFPEQLALASFRIPFSSLMLGAVVSQGGFGEVARGSYHGQVVAVKRLLASRRTDKQSIHSFFKEIQLTATLDHECLVAFIGVAWDTPANLCMVSEFMQGGDLRSLLARYATSGHANGHDDTKLRIALQIAHGLTYLHGLGPPVVHRDLKSRNVLLTSDMDAKLIDFGISCERQDVTMTAGVGTSLWMAPEVMLGERYDESADVFSFGVILSELDTHELPYDHARNSTSGQKVTNIVLLRMIAEGKLKPRFTDQANPNIVSLARDCLHVHPRLRPPATEVLCRLQRSLESDRANTSARTRTAIDHSTNLSLRTRDTTRFSQGVRGGRAVNI